MTELYQLDFDSSIGVSAEPCYLFSFLEVLVLIVNFTPKLDVFTIHNFLADSDISPFHKSNFFTLNDIDRIIVLNPKLLAVDCSFGANFIVFWV